MNFSIPEKIEMIMREFNLAGHAAFLVGGAVRDLFIGRVPKDYDLVTAARTEEIIALAGRAGWKVIDHIGRNFGVVVVVLEGEAVEVATYRGECYGADCHKPEQVWYASTLEEDLARRDFSFNAMAMDLDGRMYDPFSGKADLEAGLIRMVGLPEKRFAEDALRMFRACRFAAELGFVIDQPVLKAIPGQLGRVAGLSLERVREEIQRIILAEWPSRGLEALVASGLAAAQCRARSATETVNMPILPELLHLVAMPQNPRFHVYDVWRHTLKTVEGVPAEPTLRWAALLHDVAKGLPGIRGVGEDGRLTDYGHDKAGAEMAAEILQRFGFNRNFANRVGWLISRHMRVTAQRTGDTGAVWHWLRSEARSGIFRSNSQLVEAFAQLGLLCLADMTATGTVTDLQLPRAFVELLVAMARQMPVSTQDLCYDSDAIMTILDGRGLMGKFLKNALIRVQDGGLENSRRAIEEAAQRWILRHNSEE